ncbi:uncharacterized protein A1O9_11909 [Exophiala aquamarina CBS 119918]|uniref:Ribosomal RNA-processing protein 17 n=1 Tax=Exophiala aquamarina CBS 119918 TaxID=1182545 RepID=A0A072P8M6_9EURO|nr:uncharacterized protein A1O9_11909 [Exophiala aquamarina CBS 119918]KEF51920.1 hypothetical protein A1O9_11909 [Exophiala aquamarina CBS 119918]
MPPPTKRRRTEPTAVEEITFDLSARQEYLTGFHKRKLQRAKQAQEAAAKRAKAERIEHRKQIREERKADLERHVREVNALLVPADAAPGVDDERESSGSDDEWSGITDLEPPPIDHEAEYVDEDKYTTVTVEAMDVTREGLFKAGQEDAEENEEQARDASEEPASEKKRRWTKDKPKDAGHRGKKKKRNFRYESKAERKATRYKERSKNKKQARERKSG